MKTKKLYARLNADHPQLVEGLAYSEFLDLYVRCWKRARRLVSEAYRSAPTKIVKAETSYRFTKELLGRQSRLARGR